MKKIIAIVFAIMITTCSVFAADIDLSSLSLDELLELRTQLNEIINEQIPADNTIGEGRFLVGSDIKEATFNFTCIDESIDIFVYNSPEELKKNIFSYINHVSLEKGEAGTVTLKDGQLLKIEDGNALIEEVKPSWAP